MRSTLFFAWACMPTAFGLLFNTPVNATSGEALEITWNRDPDTVIFYATKDFKSFFRIGAAQTSDFQTTVDFINVPAGSGYIIVAYTYTGKGPLGSTQTFRLDY